MPRFRFLAKQTVQSPEVIASVFSDYITYSCIVFVTTDIVIKHVYRNLNVGLGLDFLISKPEATVERKNSLRQQEEERRQEPD